MENLVRDLPSPHICRMLVYRKVFRRYRTDVALSLGRHIVNPEKVIILVVHSRAGLHVPLHDHSFRAKFLYGREQID